MQDALQFDLNQEVIMLWHKDTDLGGLSKDDCIVLPGGFSYGDYLRCGAIARFSPIMQSVSRFATEGGKVFGVCNGFQILCESHLLPGALLRNVNRQFISTNIHLRGVGDKGNALKIPIAHGEGCYYADDRTLDELEAGNQVIYRYSDESGNIVPAANLNGSFRNIAGICSKDRNVFGMMPHPERACSEALGNIDGQAILRALFIHAAAHTSKAAVANF
jgi:phosphoribosylformylglycinamidine synthase